MTNNESLQQMNFDSLFEEIGEDSILMEKQALEQQASVHADPDDFIFRRLKTSAGKNFVFFHQDEEGKDTNVVAQDKVIGFRGVPIKTRFGFSLYDAANQTTACRTTGLVLPSGSKVDSSHPMTMPVYSPAMIGDESNTAPRPRPEVFALNPIGSRGKSCAECVQAGEHILVNLHESGDPAQSKTNYCGLQSSILFAVFQVGILKPEMRNGSPYDNVDWVSPEEVMNVYGAPMFNGPFIINMQIPRKAATCRISNKSFQPILDPFNAIPASVKTTAQFIQSLKEEGLVIPKKIGGNDELMMLAFAEVWAGRPRESCAKAFERTGAVPLWNLLNKDPMFSNDPSDLLNMVKAAWGMYVGAKDSGKKASSVNTNNQVAPATTQQQIQQAAPAQEPIMTQAVPVESQPVTQPPNAAAVPSQEATTTASNLSSLFTRNDA